MAVGNYKQYNYPQYTFADESAAASACGPFSVANALNKNPIEIMNYMTAAGYASHGSGTYWGGINGTLNHYGVESKLLCTGKLGQFGCAVFEEWKNYVKSGKMGIILFGAGKNTYFTRGGHYCLVSQYNPKTDMYFLVDSASVERTRWFSFSEFDGNIKNLYTVGLPWNNETGGAAVVSNNYVFAPKQIKIGFTGNDVFIAQCILKARGFYKGAIDGIFGNGMDAAVREYQKARGLVIDGVIGTNTWTDLLGMTGTSHELKEIQLGSSGLEVLLLQEILAAIGYYHGSLDRVFGLGARTGVQILQKKLGMSGDGICGKNTWTNIFKLQKA